MTVTITNARAADLPCQFWTFDAPVLCAGDGVDGAVSVTTTAVARSSVWKTAAHVSLTVVLCPLGTSPAAGARTRHGHNRALVIDAVHTALRDAVVGLECKGGAE